MPDLDDTLGDMMLDDVFGSEPQIQASTTPQVEPPANAQVEEPFLKTASGTVYKTAEDARKGTQHKDELIERLRQDAIARTGVDPITGNPVRQQQSAAPPINYTQSPDEFLKDLAQAAESKDTKRYVQVQQKLVEDTISPYAGMMASFAKMQAEEAVANEFSSFRDFKKSDDYAQTLEENRPLKFAIQQAESNPQAAAELPEFYKMAYKLNTARKLPEIVRAPAQTSTARPTVSSTATPAAPSNGARHEAPSLATSAGRKALIADFEARGIGSTRF